MAKSKRIVVPIQVRMSPDLHRRIVESANSESPAAALNYEICRLLELGLKADKVSHLTMDDIVFVVEEVEKKLMKDEARNARRRRAR
jgi:hypothetical protein